MTGPPRRHAAIGVGAFVALICAWFVGKRLASDWPQARHAMASADVGWLVLAVALAAGGMTVIALNWAAVLEALGSNGARRGVVAWYFAGEIGKYVPGGVWPIMGRAELARRGGVTRTVAYSSVALSLGVLYLAAALVSCALLPFALDAVHGPLALVLLVPPIGLVSLHPAVSGQVERAATRLLRRPSGVRVPGFGEGVLLVARYVPAWLLIGGATWSVARALDPHVGLGRVLLAATVSWLAGFLAVPVPGGVGVREAVFVATAGTMAPGVAASTAVLTRVAFVVVDLVGAAVSAPVAPRRPSSTAPGGAPI